MKEVNLFFLKMKTGKYSVSLLKWTPFMYNFNKSFGRISKATCKRPGESRNHDILQK